MAFVEIQLSPNKIPLEMVRSIHNNKNNHTIALPHFSSHPTHLTTPQTTHPYSYHPLLRKSKFMRSQFQESEQEGKLNQVANATENLECVPGIG